MSSFAEKRAADTRRMRDYAKKVNAEREARRDARRAQIAQYTRPVVSMAHVVKLADGERVADSDDPAVQSLGGQSVRALEQSQYNALKPISLLDVCGYLDFNDGLDDGLDDGGTIHDYIANIVDSRNDEPTVYEPINFPKLTPKLTPKAT
jgi:hypothetical protein